MEALEEMSQFLDLGTRLDLKAIALQHILSEYLLDEYSKTQSYGKSVR